MSTNRNILKMAGMGSLVGIFSGLCAVLYRFLINQTDAFRAPFFQKSGPELVSTLIAVLICGVVAAKLLTWAPFSGGSGIPQIHAELEGYIRMKPLRVLLSKLTGGTLLNIIGLSLGREGPSIQMGGMAGKLVSRLDSKFSWLRITSEEKMLLISAGAGAGLAAAFNAPLAGVIFCVEELHKKVSHTLFVPIIAATTTANAVSYALMGKETSFSFTFHHTLDLRYLWVALIIGIATGLVGVVFNYTLLKMQDLWNHFELDLMYKLMFLGIVGLFIGRYFYDITGGGHHLVESFARGEYSLTMLLILLVTKLFYTTFAYGSGAQGGIFLPVLVLGAIVGSVIFHLVAGFGLSEFLLNFIILGMVGILASVVQAPILAIILVLEMTGSFSLLLFFTVTSLVSMLVAEICHTPPIYDSLYERIVKKL
ncbi:ClC family H(+)/Cl(-) exchange transporter [Peptoniphilus equinus]|uniref:ClC family H(+)/Cl(-) exchange transporter n=1 Tax=Peptoniphilus equinus TaxID=3016343 RepID=A0ABY7QUQ6_9FIRM|nr:ClC family H(+)/Cl(-) exchange transporter [Peptoniphilus equinus]WBW50010.1 ClC family H(+)/Cl(-) exchange transporter [Peptoniphilus equinus]